MANKGEFISLKKFLNLTYVGGHDSIHNSGPLFRRLCAAQDFVVRYELAERSWKLFGDDGPPLESKVITLAAGHGGGIGCQRIFKGVSNIDFRYFNIERHENLISLVERRFWWAQISTLDEFEKVEKEVRGRP
jgi:hypothetical protein